MTSEDFCRALCSLIALTEVPIGYVFRTPYRRPDGDAIAIYLRVHENGTVRLEDDGQTVASLEAAGFDLESETGTEAFADILREHAAFYDEAESVIHSTYVPVEKAPLAALSFAILLARLPDLELLVSSRVRSTFREDLVALVERQFGHAAAIELNSPLQASMKDYPVDVIVRSPDGRALAIFAATSELKALEALLFWGEYRKQRIDQVRALLMLETAQPRDIKARTFSRVMNSGIILASMDGEEIAIREKMQDSLIA